MSTRLLRWPALSLYPNLVITFLLVLLPLYALSFQMNTIGSDIVKEEVSNSMHSRVQLYMDLLDYDFDKIIGQLQDAINNENLQRLSATSLVMDDFEKSRAILELQSRLFMIKNSSRFVESVNVHIPLLNRTVSSNASYISDFDRAEYNAMLTQHPLTMSWFQEWEGRLFIRQPITQTMMAPGEALYVMVVELSKSEIEKALQQFIDGTGGGAIWWQEESRTLISTESQTSGRLRTALLPYTQDEKPALALEKGYVGASEHSARYGATLMLYVAEEEAMGALNTFRQGLILLSVVSLVIVVLYSYRIYEVLHRPLMALVRSFRKVESGDLDVKLPHRFKHEFQYLYDHFNAMVSKLKVLVHEVYEQQYRASISELRQLQSQINPHFLYNSFFLLYRMAKRQDYDHIVRFTKYLGDYFQFITHTVEDEVDLAEELNHAKLYTDIQSFRFSHRIEVVFESLPVDCRSIRVPRLIVQPLIENAYHHALEKRVRDGKLGVSVSVEADQLVIRVIDNGESLGAEDIQRLNDLLQGGAAPANHTGLYNVHRRLQIRFGTQSGLFLSLREGGGLVVTMRIVLTEKQVDEPNKQIDEHGREE